MKTRFRLLLVVITTLPLSVSGEEKIEFRKDGVVLMTHGEEYFKEYFDSQKAEKLAELDSVLSELKKKRPTKEVLLQRKRLTEAIGSVRKYDKRHPVQLADLQIGKVGYTEMDGWGYNREVAVRVIDISSNDEFIGVLVHAVTHHGIKGKTVDSDPIWFRGFATEKLTDNTVIYLTGLYKATGTKKYLAVRGGENTVKVIEPWEPESEKPEE